MREPAGPLAGYLAGYPDGAMTDPTRLDSIEFKLAHLERALTELSDALAHQQRQIELLNAANRQLRGQLETLEAGSGGSGASADDFEKPPHY